MVARAVARVAAARAAARAARAAARAAAAKARAAKAAARARAARARAVGSALRSHRCQHRSHRCQHRYLRFHCQHRRCHLSFHCRHRRCHLRCRHRYPQMMRHQSSYARDLQTAALQVAPHVSKLQGSQNKIRRPHRCPCFADEAATHPRLALPRRRERTRYRLSSS